MKAEKLFKAVLDNDNTAIVLCDLKHKIQYMNKKAISRYKDFGGENLIGKSLLNCHNSNSNNRIEEILEWFKKDKENNKVYTSRNEKENKDGYMVALRDENNKLIGYYEKHEYRDRETGKFYYMK